MQDSHSWHAAILACSTTILAWNSCQRLAQIQFHLSTAFSPVFLEKTGTKLEHPSSDTLLYLVPAS